MVLSEEVDSLISALGGLWILHKKGVISRQEFSAVKESILLRIIGVGTGCSHYKQEEEE